MVKKGCIIHRISRNRPLPIGTSSNRYEFKELENIFKKIKHEDFSSHQRNWKNFEQKNESIAPNVLLASQNSAEITLVYKSEHNSKRKNNVLLLMNDDDNEKFYHFAV